jgi:hypothetical protein
MTRIHFALALVTTLLLAAPARAASSKQTIHLQGVLRDVSGMRQSVPADMLVTIYSSQTAAADSFIFQHNQLNVGVADGFFSIELEVPPMSFDGIDDAWVGIRVSGDDAELPRQHLGAVPYAYSAERVSGIVPIEHGGTGSATQSFVDLSSDQPSIAGNKTFTGLVSTARGVDGTPMRVCSGATPIDNTDWTPYSDAGTALTVIVDTSGCGFKSTPHFVTSLACNNICWMGVGGNSPYKASANGFQVFVNYGAGITPAAAKSNGWHIEWIAVGN